MNRILIGLATSLAFVAPASAGVVFTDNFDGQGTANTSDLNFLGLANFFAPPSEGSIDLVQSGQFGITCAGGNGKCVDLDGSTNNGGTLVSKTLYSFNTGDLIDLTFQISGDQRNAGPDLWFGGFFNLPIPFYGNAGPIMAASFYGNTGCGNFSGGAVTTNSALLSSGPICPTNGNDAFSTRQLAFRAAAPGKFRLVFGDYTAGTSDNQGALSSTATASAGAGW